MNGILSGLPPGLAGYVASQQMQQQQQGNQLQQLQGMLSIQNALEEQKLNPLKRAQLELALKRAQQNNALIAQLSGGGETAPQGALAQGASVGDVGPTVTNAARIPQGLLSPGGMGIDRQTQALLLSGDPGLMALGKAKQEQAKPIVGREGAPVLERNPDGSYKVAFSAPKSQPGIQLNYGPQGQATAAGIPGYSQAAAQLTGAETGAQEAARAAHDIVQIPGQPVQTRAQLINRVSPQGVPQPAPRPIQPGVPIAGTSPLVVPTPAATAGAVATAKDRAEAGVKYESGIIEAGQKARGNLTTLQILAPNLEKLPTGPMYPLLAGGASYFKQFGIDVGAVSKDLGAAQATDAILKQLALKTRDPAGGGMPGNMSDKDREFLVDSIPGLQKLPDGNRQLIEILTKLEQRKIDEASIVSRMQSAGKNSNEIREALTQFANSRPMFTQ